VYLFTSMFNLRKLLKETSVKCGIMDLHRKLSCEFDFGEHLFSKTPNVHEIRMEFYISFLKNDSSGK
jgi:hypothetical protein